MKPISGKRFAAVIPIMIFGLLSLLTPSFALHVGDIVEIKELTFSPDTLIFPADTLAVLVVQNREQAPIQHEIFSPDLFQAGTVVSVQGTGEIESQDQRVIRVLLSPGDEVVIWFQAQKGQTYTFFCTINGHAMLGTIKTSPLQTTTILERGG
jgi:uncharacterized cupredoxin-like copper-binding protein